MRLRIWWLGLVVDALKFSKCSGTRHASHNKSNHMLDSIRMILVDFGCIPFTVACDVQRNQSARLQSLKSPTNVARFDHLTVTKCLEL